MGCAWIRGLAILLVAGTGWTQSADRLSSTDSTIVLGGPGEFLAAGAEAMRAGDFEEGIQLTMRGLERDAPSNMDRSAALSNLCAAYSAIGDPDKAIEYCNQSLGIHTGNWRAFSNRAYAYWLKGMYAEARFDVDAAAAINPTSRQVASIRAMINEAVLQPRVSTEDRQ
jgi:tetratricopeptide (TPR) repeat protein